MLRGMYAGRRLEFDAEGNLAGKAKIEAFGLSALRVDQVEVAGSEVEIDARREGLAFYSGGKSLPSGKIGLAKWGRVKVEIGVDPQHPEKLKAALAKIFSVGFDAALAEDAPDYWRPWLQHPLDGTVQLQPAIAGVISLKGMSAKEERDEGLRLPMLAAAPRPIYTAQARNIDYKAAAVIGTVVGANGLPRYVFIVKPAGMGLDEAAVDAVKAFRFKPAELQGKPVPVQIHIQVSFRTR